MKDKKGFTLIELLAVIIILGIIMLIAIPSVTRLINDSRKKTYIDTAKQYIKGATTLVNSGELDVYDTGTTYYIPSSCINVESGGQSPYGGEFAPAYILVTYDNNSYNFYWMSTDNQKMGIKTPTSIDKLEVKSVESSVETSDVMPTKGIDGRSKIVVFESDCSSIKETTESTKLINGKTGEEIKTVEYPEGKNKETVVTEDIVKIGTEEFYVVKHDGNDLILLARYNLKVGSIYDYNNNKIGEYTINDEGFGIQSSEANGYQTLKTHYGTIPYSNSNYWAKNIGTKYEGELCNAGTFSFEKNCAYIYDENSLLYSYINDYKNYLEKTGIIVKEARLMSAKEAFELGCGGDPWTCSRAVSFMKNISFWLGTAYDTFNVWCVSSGASYGYYGYPNKNLFGIRPIIVI